MPYRVGDKVTLPIREGDGRARTIEATVLSVESPGVYRCQTNMGIAILTQPGPAQGAITPLPADFIP